MKHLQLYEDFKTRFENHQEGSWSVPSDKYDESSSDLEKLVHTMIYNGFEQFGPVTSDMIQQIDQATTNVVERLEREGWITKAVASAKQQNIL